MALLCFGNKKVEDSQAKQRNEEIERMIRRDQKQRERQVKMLLLGTYSLDILLSSKPSLHDFVHQALAKVANPRSSNRCA